ncbi:hypothetical protein J7K86_01610 [bacterium]|nr:hypothetical protein [bacterium]
MNIESEKNQKRERVEIKRVIDPKTKAQIILEMHFDKNGKLKEIYRKNKLGEIEEYVNVEKIEEIGEEKEILESMGLSEKSADILIQSDIDLNP